MNAKDSYWALWDGAANADITSRIEATRKIIYSRTVGLTIEESDKLRTWIDATLSILANAQGSGAAGVRLRINKTGNFPPLPASTC